jgi:hypothetical protein
MASIKPLVLGLALALQACNSPSEAARQRFVQRFLTSVKNDTPFFRAYVKGPDRLDQILTNVRPRLSSDFPVVRHESHGDGSFEYVVRCGLGTKCLVFLFENEGKLVEADVMLSEK